MYARFGHYNSVADEGKCINFMCGNMQMTEGISNVPRDTTVNGTFTRAHNTIGMKKSNNKPEIGKKTNNKINLYKKQRNCRLQLNLALKLEKKRHTDGKRRMFAWSSSANSKSSLGSLMAIIAAATPTNNCILCAYECGLVFRERWTTFYRSHVSTEIRYWHRNTETAMHLSSQSTDWTVQAIQLESHVNAY